MEFLESKSIFELSEGQLDQPLIMDCGNLKDYEYEFRKKKSKKKFSLNWKIFYFLSLTIARKEIKLIN